MLKQRQLAETATLACGFATSAATAPGEPGEAGIMVDAALIAELEHTFDLDRLVAEAVSDPFRRC